MRTSIATVSLSGTLDEKLEAIAAAKFDARGDLRERPRHLQRHAGRRAPGVPRARPRHRHPAAVPRLRGHAGRPARARLRARRAQVRRHAGARLRPPDDLQQRVAREPGRHRPRRGRPAASSASAPPRRGLRVAFEALAWGRHINDYRDAWEAVRRADHPAVGLVLDSFHILARNTDLGADARHPGRPDLPGAARRRAAARTWTTCPGAATSATSPARATCRCSTSWRRWRRRATTGALSLEIFNDQFRAGSARSVAVDGQRSLRFLLDQLAARPGQRRRRPRRPAAARASRSGVSSSSSPSTMATRRGSRRCSPGSASAAPGGTGPRR